MKKIKRRIADLIWIILICGTYLASAQSSYEAGILPAININKKLKNDWKLNFKTESRQAFEEGFFQDKNTFDYNYILTDFALLGSRKVGFQKTVALGYLLRFREGQIFHRTIQQFIIKKKYTDFQLAHRISTDQTFAQEEPTEYRFRYRISSEIPLSGQSLDPREFYLKMNHEYLNAFEASEYDLEIRFVPLLGYAFTNKNKVELGLDYRLGAFINNAAENSFWGTINWYISL